VIDDFAKACLHDELRFTRQALVWKLDGLPEYDIRRPLTATGTNLLGLVKHVASVELGYFGDVFGRPADRPLPWFDEDAEPDADLWVPAEESRAEIVDLHHFSAEHSDATIEALPLDAEGLVPWWGADGEKVTLQQILVHMCVETARHAGQADILREMVDGAVGQVSGDANVTERTADEWAEHCARIEAAAREAARGAGEPLNR